MYDKRIKIFIGVSALFLLICVIRLMQMQLIPDSSIRDKIAQLKQQKGHTQQLKTIRGRILDRKGRLLAVDVPQFELHISYKFSSYFDDRIIKAKLLNAERRSDAEKAKAEAAEQIETAHQRLQEIIGKCVHFGYGQQQLEQKSKSKNEQIWNMRAFQAWRHNCPKSELLKKYNNPLEVKKSEFLTDFENHFPDANERLLLVAKENISEMHESLSLMELKTEDDIFTAQLEFMNIDGVEIVPTAKRLYPYGSSAAQTIGWVSPAHNEDKKIFADDKFLRYLGGELCGRRGAEYICESILRGRRGEIFYDIDGNESLTENQPGKDVRLTLDIELQKKIESFFSEYEHDPNCGQGISAVVIEISTGEILAMLSLPSFDLNRARYDYDHLISDGNTPIINRAINKTYPPGSSVKPLILIAALQSGKITPYETISCSAAQKTPEGWPQCWITKKYSWLGHDEQFAAEGGNTARNAIRGSCNIYFSRLADRIEPEVLQRWLFDFGYGRQILSTPAEIANGKYNRRFLQAAGTISSSNPKHAVTTFEQIPPLQERERKMFGIGQGNLWATPLQITNAIAAIARGGLFEEPRLFIEKDVKAEAVSLGLKQQTIDTIYDGMYAVVNKVNGTAYNVFLGNNFSRQDVKVYGKTGSTERPDNAWFAGFAKDSTSRGIAVAVVVEGGQHGSSDAAPLARQIIQFCIDSGYLGKPLSVE